MSESWVGSGGSEKREKTGKKGAKKGPKNGLFWPFFGTFLDPPQCVSGPLSPELGPPRRAVGDKKVGREGKNRRIGVGNRGARGSQNRPARADLGIRAALGKNRQIGP